MNAGIVMTVTTDNVQRRRNCWHEAGHAVGWTVNGDAVLLIVADITATLSEEQRRLAEQTEDANRAAGRSVGDGMGYTAVRAQERACPSCKGTVSRDVSNQFKVNLRLSDECSACMDLLTSHAACVLAGGTATSHLERGTSAVDILNNACRNLCETRHDRAYVEGILSAVIRDQGRREAVRAEAGQRAQRWIEQEWNAVAAVADALLEMGVLDGERATQIIQGTVLRS